MWVLRPAWPSKFSWSLLSEIYQWLNAKETYVSFPLSHQYYVITQTIHSPSMRQCCPLNAVAGSTTRSPWCCHFLGISCPNSGRQGAIPGVTSYNCCTADLCGAKKKIINSLPSGKSCYFKPGLGSSKVLVLGTWCKILSTWYLLVLDILKFKSTWYLLVLEGKVLDTCPSTFKYFCQLTCIFRLKFGIYFL